MPWTLQQFEDIVTEIASLGPIHLSDGCCLREVTVTTGETFMVDTDLIFATREEAEACRAELIRRT